MKIKLVTNLIMITLLSVLMCGCINFAAINPQPYQQMITVRDKAYDGYSILGTDAIQYTVFCGYNCNNYYAWNKLEIGKSYICTVTYNGARYWIADCQDGN